MRDLYDRREAGAVPPFFRLGNVVTTIDAVNADGQPDRQPEAVEQVAVADHLVPTKGDLVHQTNRLVARVGGINPSAPLWLSSEPVDADALLTAIGGVPTMANAVAA